MSAIKPYTVTARFSYDGPNTDPYEYEVFATSQNEAIKRARWQMELDGHLDRITGPAKFRAVVKR